LFEQPTLREARDLIEAQGLRFEPGYDDLAGLYEGGVLIACGARSDYVLKMVAIDPGHQGTDALGALMTRLILSGLEAGQDTLFVFTRPQNVASFEALNFRLLATHGSAALLEHGPGLEAYLQAHAAQISSAAAGHHGAVVLNGNPFTLGHLHLVATASRQVDHLFVFVVREDQSSFPFEARMAMATEATAHLGNVTVLDTSRYAVSAGTFPSYFLKELDGAALAQMQLDLRLFAQRLAPPFRIRTRFVGAEPLCATTAAYNRTMAEVLGECGLGCVELPRLEAGGAPISATRVRRAFAEGDGPALAALVPPSTLAYLRSRPAQAIAEQLRTMMRGA
jgi:[citrate (pro-3S)-lyase] ligase